MHLQVVEKILQIQSDALLQRPVLQCVQDGFPCLCRVLGYLVEDIEISQVGDEPDFLAAFLWSGKDWYPVLCFLFRGVSSV